MSSSTSGCSTSELALLCQCKAVVSIPPAHIYAECNKCKDGFVLAPIGETEKWTRHHCIGAPKLTSHISGDSTYYRIPKALLIFKCFWCQDNFAINENDSFTVGQQIIYNVKEIDGYLVAYLKDLELKAREQTAKKKEKSKEFPAVWEMERAYVGWINEGL